KLVHHRDLHRRDIREPDGLAGPGGGGIYLDPRKSCRQEKPHRECRYTHAGKEGSHFGPARRIRRHASLIFAALGLWPKFACILPHVPFPSIRSTNYLRRDDDKALHMRSPSLSYGKTALVTGRAKPIGRTIASAFASSGSNVAIIDLDGSTAEQ